MNLQKNNISGTITLLFDDWTAIVFPLCSVDFSQNTAIQHIFYHFHITHNVITTTFPSSLLWRVVTGGGGGGVLENVTSQAKLLEGRLQI